MKTILHCGTLYTCLDTQAHAQIAIEIDGGRIGRVAPLHEADGWTGTVIDLTDHFVMPGLIDAHTHVCADGAGGFGNEGTLVGTCVFDAIERAQADLRAGFTTLRDEGAQNFIDVSLRDAIAAGRVVGPRMLVSGPCIGATGGHADTHYAPPYTLQTALIADGPDAARKAARYAIKYGADQIKLMATGGVMSIGDEPGAQELTYEELRAAIEIAEMHGKLSSAHAHGAAGIKAAIRAGITSIEHGMMMDDECVELFVQYGTYLIPTIIAGHQIATEGEQNGLRPDFVEKAKRCLENHHRNMEKCRAAGVTIGFGTDAGTPLNLHGKQALECVLMRQAGFSEAEILIAATRTNAKLLRMEDQIGAIAKGMVADIIAMPGNPLEDISAMQSVSFVMKDGAVIQ